MIREERRNEESSGIKENEDPQKKVEKNDDVRSLEFSRVMQPMVTEVNWRREGSGSIKEKITKKDSVRKLENTKMKNSAESDAERSLKLSELIDSDLYWVKEERKDRRSCTGMESWRKRTKGERGLADDAVETTLSQAGASASSADDITRRMVKKDTEPAEHHPGYKYYAGNWVTSVF